MSGSTFYPVAVPFAEGTVGTGPVDLYLATQVFFMPEGFDHVGGSGEIFNRAIRWFFDAEQAATSRSETIAALLGAARAANNSAVYALRMDHPDSFQAAFDLLREAEEIITKGLGREAPKDLRHAIFANLGGLLALTGHESSSRRYLSMAQSLGDSAA